MAIYFKYKSAKNYDSIPIVDPFISVWNLKLKIFESKRYGRGKDFDLVITNSQCNQHYIDDNTMIPKNTSVSIRRVPGLPLLPIVIPSLTESKQVFEEEGHESVSDFECDDFGDDVYAIPKILPVQSGNPVPSAPTSSINDEDTKIKNLIHTPGFGQSSNGYGFGRGGMEWKKPPSGYVCHRCNVPGHYIQHCPTNGDPNYDMNKMKLLMKSMLLATPSGGSVGVSKTVEGLLSASSSSSKSSFRDIPPELYCPLCKGLMKDAVIASKCCFSSFCDKCIRDHIMSNSNCVCGARNILVDALLPNITLRVTVNRILESSNSSSEHGVSAPLPRILDMVSAHNTPRELSFPTESSAALKVEATKTSEKCPLVVDELQQNFTAGEAVKMKKRKKPCDVDVVNMNWGVAQDHVVAESNMYNMNSTAYYPAYSTGMQYMSNGHHVLPEESFREQYVETRKAGFKRKREIGIDQFSSVVTC